MDPRVMAQLECLMELINKSTGITNSFDYNHAVEMFEKFRAEAIPFDPEQIRVWLVTTGGLQPNDAKAVAAMASKFAGGKKVKHR
jgi:hypothetical protein